MGQDCIFSGKEFRLDEKITESRMGGIGLRGVEDHFSITRQFDFARALRIISQ